ncbi:helix-turn-helix domain-containing protein [Ciceribacter sp. RN22]|uniref:helix-turn-helix domain-containing protein n=1 Tax=Ciceribacter sp. RN22 TaxID=2954932 RepID=UPI002091FE5F|nr:helix-turn-helix domain-containing protein [Ciceribacter sp. RN22]MCO6181014.1 hypothetical protein [Ciceribacter sp. RN22]
MSAHPSNPLYLVLPDFGTETPSTSRRPTSPVAPSSAGQGNPRRVPAPRQIDAGLRTALMERLQALYADLCVLLGGSDSNQGVPLTLESAPVPVIRVASHGSICVGAETGRFTFVEADDAAVFITRSKERMAAHIAGRLLRAQCGAGLHARQPAMPALVGMSFKDVERALLLETLLHCRGNATRAASMLDITADVMREKLRALWGGQREGGE